MASFLGRNSRRRRVLNEDALAASASHVALAARAANDEAGQGAPRYTEAAGVEHHPQVTDFLPRRYRTIAFSALAGVLVTAGVSGLEWAASGWAMQYGAGPAAPLALYVAEQLAAWLSGALWFTGAAICLLVYALRRHRIDDFRGRYRVWLAGVAACIALSIASVTPVHDLIALVATQLTQHGALRDHAAWWLALAGLPVAWIVLRALVDARESPIATVLLFGGVVCFGLALASYLSAWPIASPRGEEVFTGAARLLGVWLTVVGFAAYGRFVVLDAQGLIVKERRRKSTRAKAKVAQDSKSMSNSSVAGGHARDVKKASAVAATAANSIRSFRQNMNAARPAAAASETRWVDGSEPEVDEYDDDDAHHGSKLSKSERKRLRKLKAQQRAA